MSSGWSSNPNEDGELAAFSLSITSAMTIGSPPTMLNEWAKVGISLCGTPCGSVLSQMGSDTT